MKNKLKPNLYITLILSFIISINCDAQSGKQTKSFEGKVIYEMVFKDKTGEMNDEQTKMFIGNEQTYFIKGNKYKSVMNGMMKMSQTYLGGDTLFNEITGMNQIMWVNATQNPDKLIDFKIIEKEENIGDEKCKLLIINSEEGTTKYYYNNNYYINPKDYKSHEFGFWNLLIEKTKSIPIKSVADLGDIYLEITAKEIIEMEIDDSIFEVPNLPRILTPE